MGGVMKVRLGDIHMEFPSMPRLDEFPAEFDSGSYNTTMYQLALQAWERVAMAMMNEVKHIANNLEPE